MDDHDEAINFINEHISNTSAFYMPMPSDEYEIDVDGIPGNTANYEFLYDAKHPGRVFMRKLACLCGSCFQNNFGECLCKSYVGPWVNHTFKVLGPRPIKVIKKKDNMVDNGEDTEEYEVEAIVGKRTTKGGVEYCVKWVGYASSDNTWLAVSRLSCGDLMEEFDRQSIVQ